MLTALMAIPLRRYSASCFGDADADDSPAASSVAPAICGVATTCPAQAEDDPGERLGSEDIQGGAGDLAGADGVTRASWSIISPRAQLTIRTPGFICSESLCEHLSGLGVRAVGG